MFTVRAGKEAIRITKLHTASADKPRRELYRSLLQKSPIKETIWSYSYHQIAHRQR